MYIERELSKKEWISNVVIKINCSQNVNMDKFEKAYIQYINDKINENYKNKTLNRMKQIRLIIVGLIFIAISIAIGAFSNTVIYTVIFTVGSFSIWEASNIWLIKNKELSINKKLYKNSLNIKTEFYKQ